MSDDAVIDLAVRPGDCASHRCATSGRLVFKGACYALERGEGDLWLEMDRIPLHLVEELVRIEGVFYQRDFVLVERIAAA